MHTLSLDLDLVLLDSTRQATAACNCIMIKAHPYRGPDKVDTSSFTDRLVQKQQCSCLCVKLEPQQAQRHG